MTEKTYNIVKQAVVDNHLEVGEDVTVKSRSVMSALAGVGAENPRLIGRHSGISMWRDSNGWTYLVNIN